MLKAGVIGLGNIGFRFNLDKLRRETWSHVSAYEKSKKTKLVGVVEINKKRITEFKKCYPNVPVFSSISELMKSSSPKIVSICTPTETHFYILKKLIKFPLKAIFCEKPIALNLNQAREMVNLCRKKKIILVVNHIRRWEDSYLCARKMIKEGKIGKVMVVTAFYSGQVFNVGTHLFDAIRFLIGKDARVVSGISFDINMPDPSISGWICFEDKIYCVVTATGKREDLIFEIDVIGNEGRMRILENGRKIEYLSFKNSRCYGGYRELSLNPKVVFSENDRFLEAINDIVNVLKKEKKKINCSGDDGLAAISLSLAMVKSAEKSGVPVRIYSYNG